ncbi:aminopeptidase N-like [Chrysoperla carnea]|uniref:aminopeptidase N-like n=1 Tax=Chrysoperla carnea TaxID=189513 RepID=UPI001D098D24|nr:aminopeptidase N-like [Chrysoperla carnea]
MNSVNWNWNNFLVLLIFCIILPLSSANDINKLSTNDVTLNYQLSDSTIPKHYVIHIQPFLDPTHGEKYLTFDGNVEITLVAQYPTNMIELNVKNLKIDKCKTNLTQLNEEIPIKIQKEELQKDVEKYVITTEDYLQKGINYVLKLSYVGTLNNTDFKGFYITSYTINSTKIEFATTMFFDGARRVIPSYDESGIRATYEISIRAHKSFQTIISNTNIKDVKTEGNWTVTSFEKTKVSFPIYLLAFVVSNLEKVSNNKSSMSVYTQPKYVSCANRSLVFGEKVIQEINTFLLGDLDYFIYMDKLDQVGIPQFSYGAMENWGLVISKEQKLLWDEKTSTTLEKESVYLTITHEFSHQWFGNLVSPSWWKYAWLSESFATYLQYVVADEAIKKLDEPFYENDWRLNEHFAIHVRQVVFNFDSLTSSHPMTHFVETPKEFVSLFDMIIYQKGASVLWMMEHILSRVVLQRGLNLYLKTNQLSSGTPNKLWDALQEAHEQYSLENPEAASKLGRLSVHDIGNSWSLQPGYPMVTVTKVKKIVKLEQKRFLTDSRNESDTVYLIPINYLLGSELKDLKEVSTQPKHFLTSKSRHIEVEQEDDFILVNNLQTGYYRVNYDKENWEKIIEYTNKTENVKNLKPVTLSQLIDDTFTFSRIGLLPYNYTLKLAELLQHVDDYVPWYAAIKHLKSLNVLLCGTRTEYNYMEFQRTLLKNVFERIISYTMNDETTHANKLKRALLFKHSCDVNIRDCRNITKNLLQEHIVTKKSIIPDDQLTIYCGGARETDEKTYTALLSRYEDIEEETEKKNLILGMGCMNDKLLLQKLITETFNKTTKIKNHILEVYLGIIDSGLNGLNVVLEIFISQFKVIERNIGEKNILAILNAFGEKCASSHHLKLFKKLNNLIKDDLKYSESLKSIEWKIQQRINWNIKYAREINDWLISNKYIPNICSIALSL